ncbi:hypothetical protein FACS1894208_05340 [Clostridia bacterium]|nr:hypothetical protein FACS1894208_05340 [Clostridia bacterium]
MKVHSKYHFKGIPGTYDADPEGVMTVLFEFDDEAEMNASGLLNDPRRTTCFVSGGKYYVGGHFETDCGHCTVTNRCVDDGDKIGMAKYLPSRRESFYDSANNFCDRDNSGIVTNECLYCRKSICKYSGACLSPYKEKVGLL